MGHWAEIDENNIVIRVIVIKEAELDTGNWGDKSKWIKTSYNTNNGKHYVPKEHQDFSEESADQSKALRYRFAGLGMKYDAENAVFYYPSSINASHIFDTTTWSWIPPIPKPENSKESPDDEGISYVWNESLYQADTGNPKTKGWVSVEDFGE